MRLFAVFLLIASLAACHGSDEDNIQARSARDSAQLRQRLNELQAEAGNDMDEAAAPVDNEAANFLNSMNGAAPVPTNGAALANGI
ncbi:MAG TPA: hypothetical protein VFW19_12500 [Allosphingosinicella sp.]|nr:hypothetical protein [Allosphingosinicella sp.]